MIYLPTIPSRKTIIHKTLVSQQLPTKYFTQHLPTQTSVLLGIPAGYVVHGVQIRLLTRFVVPGSTSLKVTIGYPQSAPGTSGDPETTFYASAFELTAAATPTSTQVTHVDFADIDPDDSSPDYADTPLGAHDVIASFVANGVGTYLANITQGEAEISILYRPY